MVETFPHWAEKLKEYYLSGESIQFMLHANVRDVFLHEGQLLTLQDFLYKAMLERTRDQVIYYDPSMGISFPDPSKRKEFFKAMNAQQALLGEPPLPEDLPRLPANVLPLLEKFMQIPGQRSAVVIHFLETMIPSAEMSFLSMDERSSLITVQRWAADQNLLRSDTLVIMICENLADVNTRVVKNPQIVNLELPLPDQRERAAVIDHAIQKYPDVKLEMQAEQLAHITAGLRNLQLEGLFRQAKRQKIPLAYRSIIERKKAIIEQECFGLVEMVNSRHNLSVVGGMEKTKKLLQKVARYVREGPHQRVPMGLFFVGPMGTGKTFVAEAFAADSQMTCIKLKNFRDRWVGSTEANLEKIFNVVKAMGPVMIIMDEVDRAMSGGQNEGDSGVSSRVYARMKAFMSDTTHRGQILWVLMSNRPDKLDVDLTRAGRIDLKIPFFFPETNADRIEVIDALSRKNHLDLQIDNFEEVATQMEGYSGAEIEALLLIADEMTAEDNRKRIRDRDLLAAIEDYIPNQDITMLELMELLAVFQCSSRRMLPERYQDMTNDDVNRRLREVKRLIGI